MPRLHFALKTLWKILQWFLKNKTKTSVERWQNSGKEATGPTPPGIKKGRKAARKREREREGGREAGREGEIDRRGDC